MVDEHRRDNHQNAGKDDHEQSDDQQCGDQPVDAVPDQKVGQRIEQISERRPDHEGQENVAQQQEHADEDQQCAGPEYELPLNPHRTTLPGRCSSPMPVDLSRVSLATPQPGNHGEI